MKRLFSRGETKQNRQRKRKGLFSTGDTKIKTREAEMTHMFQNSNARDTTGSTESIVVGGGGSAARGFRDGVLDAVERKPRELE